MSKSTLILFLSDYKHDAKTVLYSLPENDKTIEGSQTNDAPVKYILKRAAKEGTPVNQIICIASEKVRNEIINEKGETVLTRFERNVIRYDQSINGKATSCLNIIPIPYNENDDTAITGIYLSMSMYLQKLEETQYVYLDYTGGLRDINFLMTTLVQYFEFNNITCKAIVYSNFHKHRIYEITYIYSMYQMINGANEFVLTGNASELKKFFDQKEHYSVTARQLLESIIAFSDVIKLCDIAHVDESAKNVVAALKQIDDSKEQDLFVKMLQALTGTIRKKLYIDKKMSTPYLIMWCLDNGLIQQALTLYTEKIPEYLLRSKGMQDFMTDMADVYGYCSLKQEFSVDTIDIMIREEDARGGKTAYGTPNFLYDNVFEFAAKNHEAIRLRNQLRKMSDCQFDSVVSNHTAKNNLKHIRNLYGKKEYKKLKNLGITETEFSSFMNVCINKLGKYHYQLLNLNSYDREFPQYTYERKEDNRGKLQLTTIKKAKLLKLLSVRESKEISNKRFVSLSLAYYLSVKMLRNRMNHAIESELKRYELDACDIIEGIIGSGFKDVLIRPSVEGITQLLRGGIDLIK